VYALQQDRLPSQPLVDEIDRQAHALLRLDTSEPGLMGIEEAAERPLSALRALIRAHNRFDAIKELRPPTNTPSARGASSSSSPTNLPTLPPMHSTDEVSSWLQRMVQWTIATRRPVSCCLAYSSPTASSSSTEWCWAVLHLACPLSYEPGADQVFPVMYLSNFRLEALHEATIGARDERSGEGVACFVAFDDPLSCAKFISSHCLQLSDTDHHQST
jgi:hypothetical protein